MPLRFTKRAGMTIFVLGLITALSSVDAAFAAVAVPGPVVGAGLPGLAVLGAAYGAIWLTRKLRNRKRGD